ncbi:hypothetical protein C8R45DRAFT_1139536 [Mycena sanguinolenta]|nr:hypothetical protein C8R45DRAFT_1139536 [Mycena sanguinolenta]
MSQDSSSDHKAPLSPSFVALLQYYTTNPPPTVDEWYGPWTGILSTIFKIEDRFIVTHGEGYHTDFIIKVARMTQISPPILRTVLILEIKNTEHWESGRISLDRLITKQTDAAFSDSAHNKSSGTPPPHVLAFSSAFDGVVNENLHKRRSNEVDVDAGADHDHPDILTQWHTSGDEESIGAGTDEVGSTQPARPQYPECRGYTSFWGSVCKLYGSGKANSKSPMGSDDPEWEKRAVAELDSAMNNFLDSVSPHPRRNHASPLQDAFFDQAAILHIAYNHVLIAVPPSLPPFELPTSSRQPCSLSICAQAARAIIHTAGIWLNKRQRLPLPSLINPIFIAGVILVLYTVATTNRGSRRAGDKNKVLVHVTTAMEILKYAEHRVQTAGRLWDLLQQLWSLGGPLPLSPAPPEEEGRTSGIEVVSSTSAADSGVSAALPPHIPDEYYTLAIPEYVPPQEESYSFVDLEGVFSFGSEAAAVGPRAGMSVEQLLADADPLDKTWRASSTMITRVYGWQHPWTLPTSISGIRILRIEVLVRMVRM